jgi:hypothetical protein
MREIGGLNRSAGRLDGHSPAGHGECYAETFPYTQVLGGGQEVAALGLSQEELE